MRLRRSILIPLTLLLPAALAFPVRAQVTNQAQLDPLAALMQSQPTIDTTSPVRAMASFDPPAVRPGEQSTYRVTFNALNDSIQWPGKIVAPSQLELRPAARGQIIHPVGTNLQPHTAFNYRARATVLGTFTVSQFDVQVYGRRVTVPAARLDVVSVTTTSAPPVLLALDAAAPNPFVGQALTVRVVLPGSGQGVVQGLSQVQFNGDGFVVDQSRVQQRIENRPRGGTNVATYTYETVITPIQTGQITLSGQGFTSGNNFGGSIVITGTATILGGQPEYILLDSDPVTLNIRPLPREGELPGFAGAIGNFTNDLPKLATNIVRVGDPVKLTVAIRGEGNLARLLAPPPPRVRDWQVFDAASDNAPPQVVQARGFASFIYTLIPTTEAACATPAIPFCFFDPQRERYVDLTIPPVPVTVKPGAQPADSQAWARVETQTIADEKEPRLGGLATSRGRTAGSLVPLQQRAWFPLMQLAPALLFVGLWIWDRRRRYLERHPDIILRRRARRALRREWRALREAAHSGDAQRFANCAVSALCVACAPHHSAEPRALVCGDVLALLDQPDCAGRAGAVVGRIFSVTDAARFDTEPTDARELLALQLGLERVLRQLEAKL
jgi:hypothetical protein